MIVYLSEHQSPLDFFKKKKVLPSDALLCAGQKKLHIPIGRFGEGLRPAMRHVQSRMKPIQRFQNDLEAKPRDVEKTPQENFLAYPLACKPDGKLGVIYRN